MALLTAPSELPVVGVVLGVAVHAALADVCDGLALGGGLGVTGRTSHLGVATCQGVFRAFVVVEIPRFPVTRVVAGLALRAQRGLVLVVFEVAIDAFAGCVLETFACMTVLANHTVVAPCQRKTRFAMVEQGDLPRGVVVAGLALLALRAFVLVVLLVAGVAGHRGLAEAGQALGVAVAALHLGRGMGVAQREARSAVVEAA